MILNWRDPKHPQAGGAEGYLFEIARRWVLAGHDVRWLCGRPPGFAATERLEGLELRRHGRGHGVFVAAAFHYLRHLRGSVDVVIDSENGIPFFSPLYSRVPKVALVHHVHQEVFGHELPAPAAALGRVLEGRLMPWAYRRDWFVAVSPSTRDDLLDLGIEAARLAVIHNGLDHAAFAPAPAGEEPMILSVGRLKRYKGLETLLEAARSWRRSLPDARLVIAGEGPQRQLLERRAQELGLASRVEFLGYVDPAEKVRLMQRAHVVVQTSLKEGWGMTVLEASACGTPVVASDVAGLRDSVRPGRTGLLVPFGDAEKLAAAVVQVMADDGTRRRLGKGARRWASRFDWQKTADRWLELLEARPRGGIVPPPLRDDSGDLAGDASNRPGL
ncbi:MAG: glycosyltransferase family 4 protein [Acidobacteriota bacterium]